MVYYNPYKKILRAFFRALKVFFTSLVSKSVLITIICFLVLMLFVNENHVSAATNDVEDIFQQCIDVERKYQDEFVLFSYVPFINQTDSWKNNLSVVYNSMINANTDIFCTGKSVSGNNVSYTVYLYYRDTNFTTTSNGTFGSSVDGASSTMVIRNYTYATKYTFSHAINNNTISMGVDYPASVSINLPQTGYKSPLLYEFLETVNGYNQTGSINYINILNSISNYLDNIEQNTDNLESKLDTIISVLNTIQQKNPTDYTSQISGITNQVNSINSSIQSQTQQQHQDAQAIQNTINNQTTAIEEQTNSINDMSDFMQDDNFSSDSITDNMPSSDEFQDITQSGFDNIFTILRTAFTSENYQDVEFTVPFSNGQKITIPSNLTENIIPEVIKGLIQMVYWYFIARFIVKDIASYIEKAKSGDIFSSSDTNIKTDML